jgi:hypothetical protein
MRLTMTSTPEQRAKHAAYMREWSAKNREKVLAAKRSEQQRHKEDYAVRHKAWRENNKDHLSKYREENREQIRKKSKEWIDKQGDDIKKYAYKSVQRSKTFAKKNGLEFDITLEWMDSKIRGVCELSGIKFDMSVKRGPNSPSIDRIDPKGPYTMENCRMVIWFLNRAKSNYDEKYVMDIYRRVVARSRLHD